MSAQLQERSCREFQILGDATEKPQDEDDEIAYFTLRWKTRASFVYRTSPNAVRANGKINRLVLEDPIGNEQECESTGGSVNTQAVSNTKYWK